MRVIQVTWQEGKATQAYKFNKSERDENILELLFFNFSLWSSHLPSFQGEKNLRRLQLVMIFFILMPFVEDLSCPGEVSDERKADLFLFMLLCRLLGS